MKHTFVVTMTSAEYGKEEFPRDTLSEAIETVASLKRSAKLCKDGVKRTYDIMVDQNSAFTDTSDHSVPIVPMDNIFRATATTKCGNTLQFFYNPDNNLVVVDIANNNGGNELLRKTLDEKKLLAHTC
jgi:hypothetical protein